MLTRVVAAPLRSATLRTFQLFDCGALDRIPHTPRLDDDITFFTERFV